LAVPKDNLMTGRVRAILSLLLFPAVIYAAVQLRAHDREFDRQIAVIRAAKPASPAAIADAVDNLRTITLLQILVLFGGPVSVVLLLRGMRYMHDDLTNEARKRGLTN
jgi:hypothetical protein